MKMQVSDAIIDIVEFALPKHTEDKMFHVCVDADMSIYTGDEPKECRRRIHFLFYRPGNYTKVFMAVEGYEYKKVEDGSKYPRSTWVATQSDDDRVFSVADLNNLNWHMTSDHDSGWRSDGVETPMHRIDQIMKNEITGNNRLQIRNISNNTGFDVFQGFKYVKADVVPDPKEKDNRNYRKIPVNITAYE